MLICSVWPLNYSKDMFSFQYSTAPKCRIDRTFQKVNLCSFSCSIGMKTIVWLIFLVFFCNSVKAKRLAFSAIQTILSRNFVTQDGKVDFVFCGDKQSSSEKLFNEILCNRDESLLSIKVANCDTREVQLNTSTFIAFSSPEIFSKMVGKIDWQTNRSVRYKHSVYTKNGQAKDIAESFEDGRAIDKVAYMLNETKESIDLVTSYMFTKIKCRGNQLIRINRFHADTM